ncbi:MAG: peptide deformylase [Rhodospirillaceae bacterium TMED8]|nr:peptide deformylase [Magnetovibrio sp.]OUT50886.1 MAG: peptide deformylase [Rhodospirillaceae bacterium TMED8]|tara:strand:+ start:2085 stop:2600 length:516 start_codon:yes stop_codon:yes gene_type:complete
MALLPIIIAPDQRLKVKTKLVEVVDDGLRTFMDDMLETMYAANGIGLAAPQVGDVRSIIVVDVARAQKEPQPMQIINPEIVWTSDTKHAHEEGCLSLPKNYIEVIRPEIIHLKYLDRLGHERELEASGILATCIQHEMDHLQGILFVDYVSIVKRSMIFRKLKKAKKQAME